MGRFELIPFESDDALASSAAAQCVTEILGAAPSQPFCLALSGGRIAQKFFSTLASESKRRVADLTFVHFFWADERCVPPADPESNFGIAQRLLFIPLAIAPERIHRIQGELAPETAASLATEEALRIVSSRVEGQPVLDLVLLGMGEDGHVASLFPTEDPAKSLDPAVYRSVTAPKPPPRRVTLGYRAIQVARQVWVLASGPGKEHALKAALRLESAIPLGRVLASRSSTRIFADLKIG